MNSETTILYRIPAPYNGDQFIEVYGDPENAWYEWRLLNGAGHVSQDTKNAGYGNAEIALRDALIATSE